MLWLLDHRSVAGCVRCALKAGPPARPFANIGSQKLTDAEPDPNDNWCLGGVGLPLAFRSRARCSQFRGF